MSAVVDLLRGVPPLARSGLIAPMRPDRLVRMGRVLRRWGATPAGALATAAVRFGDRVAVVDEERSVTYAELDERTSAMAAGLVRSGIGEGDAVGILCRNHLGFVEAAAAVSKAGADTVYLNTEFAGPQVAGVVEREGIRAIVHDAALAEVAAAGGAGVDLYASEGTGAGTLAGLAIEGDAPQPAGVGRVIILTSGTTGTPKGARRAETSSLTPAVALLSAIPFRARDTTVIAPPLFHAWGFAHLTLGMAFGSTLVLRRRFDPEATLAAIAEHRATVLAVVPVMLQRLLALPPEVRDRYDTSSLRVVAASGSQLSGEVANRFMDAFGDILYNLYGSTEVAWASIAGPEDLRAAPGTAGRPPLGTTVRILDDGGRELPVGETGRIFVRNDMLFEGYTGGGSKDVVAGMMATGDVGRFDAEGRLFVEGRDDEMIVSGGENVFPHEVEEVLLAHPAIADAAVVGVDDEEFGQRLRAYVVPARGATIDAGSVREHVRSNLARYKVPRDVEVVEELPRTATGKVLKRELGR